MFKKLMFASALMLLSTFAWAQDEPPPPPPDGDFPHFVVAPSPDVEPPGDVEMTGDPEMDGPVVVETMFAMMDTDGNGELSLEELTAWIVHVHVPMGPPPGDHDGCHGDGCHGDGCMDGCHGDGCHGDGCMDGCHGDGCHGDGCMDGCHGDGCHGDGCMDGCTGDGCHGDGCMGDGCHGDGCHADGCMGDDHGDGVSAGDEGVEGLPGVECSEELHEVEMGPVEEGVSCPHSESEGNLVNRTLCNVDGHRDQAISLPPDRAADCFNLAAIVGNNIVFEIINEDDGALMFHTNMGKEAFDHLVLTGEAIYRVNLISADEPEAAITVQFIDHPMF